MARMPFNEEKLMKVKITYDAYSELRKCLAEKLAPDEEKLYDYTDGKMILDRMWRLKGSNAPFMQRVMMISYDVEDEAITESHYYLFAEHEM